MDKGRLGRRISPAQRPLLLLPSPPPVCVHRAKPPRGSGGSGASGVLERLGCERGLVRRRRQRDAPGRGEGSGSRDGGVARPVLRSSVSARGAYPQIRRGGPLSAVAQRGARGGGSAHPGRVGGIGCALSVTKLCHSGHILDLPPWPYLTRHPLEKRFATLAISSICRPGRLSCATPWRRGFSGLSAQTAHTSTWFWLSLAHNLHEELAERITPPTRELARCA